MVRDGLCIGYPAFCLAETGSARHARPLKRHPTLSEQQVFQGNGRMQIPVTFGLGLAVALGSAGLAAAQKQPAKGPERASGSAASVDGNTLNRSMIPAASRA
jgi:hypothetical protein